MRSKEQAIFECVSCMAALRFFPTDEFGRGAIMQIVNSMSSTVEQVDWLAREMLRRFNDWPGPQEMRALFCMRYKPVDGHEEDFPANHRIAIEEERKSYETLPVSRQLSASITEDPEMQRMMQEIAEKRTMPSPSKPKRVGPTQIGELL